MNTLTSNELADKALALAVLFHDTYERLAPKYGYETRQDTKRFDPVTPNGQLMVAVCLDLLSQERLWSGSSETSERQCVGCGASSGFTSPLNLCQKCEQGMNTQKASEPRQHVVKQNGAHAVGCPGCQPDYSSGKSEQCDYKALYEAGIAAWNPVYEIVLKERDQLRAELATLRSSQKADEQRKVPTE